MIINAIIALLKTIINCYTDVADIASTVPFAVLRVDPKPIRTKDGVVGYEQRAEILIVDDNLERLNMNTIAIIAAISSMEGTIAGCKINDTYFEDETGFAFDDEAGIWKNTVNFLFDTDNR